VHAERERVLAEAKEAKTQAELSGDKEELRAAAAHLKEMKERYRPYAENNRYRNGRRGGVKRG